MSERPMCCTGPMRSTGMGAGSGMPAYLCEGCERYEQGGIRTDGPWWRLTNGRADWNNVHELATAPTIASHRCARCNATLDEASVERHGERCFVVGDAVRWEVGDRWHEGPILVYGEYDMQMRCVRGNSSGYPFLMSFSQKNIRRIPRPGSSPQDAYDRTVARANSEPDPHGRLARVEAFIKEQNRLMLDVDKLVLVERDALRRRVAGMSETVPGFPSVRRDPSGILTPRNAKEWEVVCRAAGISPPAQVYCPPEPVAEMGITLHCQGTADDGKQCRETTTEPQGSLHWRRPAHAGQRAASPSPALYDGLTAADCYLRWCDNRALVERGGSPLYAMTPAQIAEGRAVYQYDMLHSHSAQLRARIDAARECERVRVQMPLDLEDL